MQNWEYIDMLKAEILELRGWPTSEACVNAAPEDEVGVGGVMGGFQLLGG